MDLIIKPLEACNFKCTFCSSTKIASTPYQKLDLSLVEQFLQRFPNTKNIIVNGGEPLLMSPDYYWEIVNLIKKYAPTCKLSFTTNLWVFYKNPDNWIKLFKHPSVEVGTSFNYGDTRLITSSEPLTDDIFINMIYHFEERIGYKPDFISVINDVNDDSAILNVLLARQLNVVCKLNYAMCSGAQQTPYMLAKIYEMYLRIYHMGLTQYEYNTQQFLQTMNQEHTTCPLSRSCDSHIRCLQPDGDYYSCGSFGDDKKYSIDFDKEMTSEHIDTPLSNDNRLFSLKDECLSCPMFNICNGCKKTIYDMKNMGNMFIENHCIRMKNVYDKFKNPFPTYINVIEVK
ncbi:MAG: SPASM domain-containing protein [Candidatus Riesia sp.]|nr:SPASM domain-containing protein [Candidatus Riesia sp.]